MSSLLLELLTINMQKDSDSFLMSNDIGYSLNTFDPFYIDLDLINTNEIPNEITYYPLFLQITHFF